MQVRIKSASGRRLDSSEDIHAAINYEIECKTEASSNAVLGILQDATHGGLAAQGFMVELSRLAPDAQLAYVVFDAPWADIAVFEKKASDSSEKKYPWGLPWWPESWPQKLLSGGISVAVLLTTFACLRFCICRRSGEMRRKSAESFTHISSTPHIIPIASPRANRMPPRVHRARTKIAPKRQSHDTLIGRSVPDDVTRLAREQEQSVGMLLEMGFEYDSAVSALHAHDFRIDRAVQSLT